MTGPAQGNILTLNVGSSSVKAAVFSARDGALVETPVLKGEACDLDGAPTMTLAAGDDSNVEALGRDKAGDHAAAIDVLLDDIGKRHGGGVLAVGHRVVHGGSEFSSPQLLTPAVVAKLEALTPLAPGHQPHNLAGIAAVKRRWPDVRQAAAFDTAFHRTQPPVAERFALPRALSEEGVIRYGFHGLSYDYIAAAAPAVMGAMPRRMIVAHLGAGASMCALLDGVSVATTMGFTALDGLPMATRCGAVDPGVLLYLLEEKGMAPRDLSHLLYNESGLFGVSGISGDMRVLQKSEAPEAREAIALFVYRAVREIGALAAALGGLDVLVFTAGIGENSSFIRKKILEGCAWLGFEVDKEANETHGARITEQDTTPSAWVIPTNEELIIARAALAVAAG